MATDRSNLVERQSVKVQAIREALAEIMGKLDNSGHLEPDSLYGFSKSDNRDRFPSDQIENKIVDLESDKVRKTGGTFGDSTLMGHVGLPFSKEGDSEASNTVNRDVASSEGHCLESEVSNTKFLNSNLRPRNQDGNAGEFVFGSGNSTGAKNHITDDAMVTENGVSSEWLPAIRAIGNYVSREIAALRYEIMKVLPTAALERASDENKIIDSIEKIRHMLEEQDKSSDILNRLDELSNSVKCDRPDVSGDFKRLVSVINEVSSGFYNFRESIDARLTELIEVINSSPVADEVNPVMNKLRVLEDKCAALKSRLSKHINGSNDGKYFSHDHEIDEKMVGARSSSETCDFGYAASAAPSLLVKGTREYQYSGSQQAGFISAARRAAKVVNGAPVSQSGKTDTEFEDVSRDGEKKPFGGILGGSRRAYRIATVILVVLGLLSGGVVGMIIQGFISFGIPVVNAAGGSSPKVMLKPQKVLHPYSVSVSSDDRVREKTVGRLKESVSANAASENSRERLVTEVEAESALPFLHAVDSNVRNVISPTDKKLASPGLLRKAMEGDALAAFEMGLRHAGERPGDVDINLDRALIWYRRAAKSGFIQGQYRLALIMEKRSGTAQNLDKAKSWYRSAAENGHVRAMHNLAIIYANEDKFSSAIKWFKKAADYGSVGSQFNLGIMYSLGLGVKKDLTASYIWFAIAALQGDKGAAVEGDKVAKRLDKGVLSSAKGAVRTWKPLMVDKRVNGEGTPWFNGMDNKRVDEVS